MRLPIQYVLIGAVVGASGACGLNDSSVSPCSAVCGDGTVCDAASGRCVIANTAGSGGSTGGANGNQGNGLPCAVANVLSSKCTSCHGATPSSGAPYSLMTRADLIKDAPNYAGQTVGQRCVARMQNSQSPMPPSYAGTLPSAQDIAAFQAWVNGGMVAGTCGTGGNGDTGGAAGGGNGTGGGTGGGTIATGGSGGGHAGGSGGGSGTGGGSGGGTSTNPCADPTLQCVDGTGAGDFLCLDPNSASGFPANAPSCTSSASCPTNYGCWATSGATTGQCLQNCTAGAGGGAGGGSGGGAGGGAGGGSGGGGGTTCTTDTWANYGQSFFATTCMSGCHQHTGEFTTHSSVTSRNSTILARIQYNMPPSGLTTAQQNRIVKYLNCGAP